MRRTTVRLVVVFAFLVATSLFGLGTAHASHVPCDATITEDTTLDSDLLCTELFSGLQIGADGVVLDLGGYTLSGNCAGFGEGPGIRTAGYSNVTIRNGTVKCFDTGIVLEGVGNSVGEARKGGENTVVNVTVENNVADASMVAWTPPGGSFGDNTFRSMARPSQSTPENGFGIIVVGSNGNNVQNNTLSSNGPVAQIAVSGQWSAGNAVGAHGNKVTENVISSQTPFPLPVLYAGDDTITSTPGGWGRETIHTGIRLGSGATGTHVAGNTIQQSGLDGISDVPIGQVRASRRLHLVAGVQEPAAEGASEAEGPGNVIENNTVLGNGFGHTTIGTENNPNWTRPRGDGIRITQISSTTIRDNTVCGNSGNGVYVEPGRNRIISNDIGVGTLNCAANGDGQSYFDLHDSHHVSGVERGDPARQNLPSPWVPPAPNVAPCSLNVWDSNYTNGDTANHECTKAGPGSGPVPTSAMRIDDAVALEGSNGGTTDFIFPVTLTPARPDPVTVNYFAAQGTAAQSTTGAVEDYREAGGQLIFLPGETSKTVTVSVEADQNPERDEFFQVFLAQNTNSVMVKSQALGVIRDDDGGNAPPLLVIEDVVRNEGTGPEDTEFVFHVRLTAPSGSERVTVKYATANGTAESEQGRQDYVPVSHILTFLPGETQKAITVSVKADNALENTEFFQVFLMDADRAATVRSQAVGVIVHDDGNPIPFL